MNINHESADFGKVVPWDSLTDEQQKSGDWILLPDVTGEPRRASKQSPVDSLFTANADRNLGRFERREHRQASGFDAVGRPLRR